MSGYNFTAMLVGLPGDGKTTIVRKMIRRHYAQYPRGLIIAHDPLRQFTRIGLAWYADVAAYRAAAAEASSRKVTMPRAVSIGGDDPDEVTRLAMEIGERVNTADRVAREILVPYDEVAERESHMMTMLEKRFLTRRRHYGCGAVYGVQDSALVEQKFFRLSTDVFLWQLPTDRARNLDAKLYLEPGTLERSGVCSLGEHEYLHVKPRIGVVDEEL